MYLRRLHVVALVIALIALLAYIVVPTIADSINAADAKADQTKAAAAFAHLTVPPDFHPLPATNLNCASGILCYHIPKPTTAISKAALIAVLHSTGAVFDPGPSYCSTLSLDRATRSKTCVVFARLDGLYISAVLRGYDPRAPRRGLRGSLVWIAPPFTPND